MPTCRPRSSACASRTGASSEVAIISPMLTARMSCTARSTAAMFGRRNSTAEFEPVGGRGQRRQFPVAEMGREDQRALAVLDQLVEHRDRRVGQLDAAAFADAPHRSPRPGRDARTRRRSGRDCPRPSIRIASISSSVFSGKGRAQVGAADPVLAQQRADHARSARAEIRRLLRIEPPHAAQRRRRRPRRARHAHAASAPCVVCGGGRRIKSER